MSRARNFYGLRAPFVLQPPENVCSPERRVHPDVIPRRFIVLVPRRPVQGRPIVFVLRPRVGARLQQGRHDPDGGAEPRSHVQRSPPVFIFCVRAGPGLNQSRYDSESRAERRFVQGSHSVCIPRIRVGPVPQQGRQDCGVLLNAAAL